MKLVYNNIIPFKGYLAMCVFPFIFVRKDASVFNKTDERHESIHLCQQFETLVASLVVTCLLSVFGVISPLWILSSPFVYLVLYLVDWAFRFVIYGFDWKEAYRNVASEQEAYVMQTNETYLKERKPFAHFAYIFRKTYKRR